MENTFGISRNLDQRLISRKRTAWRSDSGI